MTDENKPPPPPPPPAPSVAAATSSFARTPLLRLLYSSDDDDDGENNDNNNNKMEKKRSVKDCLRYKTLLRPQVQKALLAFQVGGVGGHGVGGRGGANSDNSSSNNNNNSNGQHNDNDDKKPTTTTLSMQDLHLSNLSLLGSLATLKRQAMASIIVDTSSSSSAAFQQQQQKSSLWYITRLATAFHFLQFLLEMKPSSSFGSSSSSHHHHQQQQHETAATASEAAAVLEAERNKMMAQVIQGVVGFCSGILQEEAKSNKGRKGTHDENHDENQTDENPVDFYTSDITTASSSASPSVVAAHVALFAFASLLRTNHYVAARPFLLLPLWKGLCEIATAYSSCSCNNGGGGGDALRSLPTELVQGAIQCLLEYLQEGMEPTLLACTRVVVGLEAKTTNTSTSLAAAEDDDSLLLANNNNAFQVKVVGFLVTRLAIFLPMLCHDDDDESDNNNALFSKGLSILSLLRGIVTVIESQLTHLLDDNNGDAQQRRLLTVFLQPYRPLATKVDKCVLNKIICLVAVSAGRENKKQNDQEEEEVGVIDENKSSLFSSSRRRLLHVFLQTKPLPASSSWAAAGINSTTTNNNDNHDENTVSDFALQSFAMGKTLLLLQVLQRAHDHTTNTTSSTSNTTNQWSAQDVESMLLICQCLVFDTLPALSESLVLMSDKNNNKNNNNIVEQQLLLQRSIRLVGQTLLRCETTFANTAQQQQQQPGRANFHRWLASWLAPPAGAGAPMSSSSLSADYHHYHRHHRHHPLTTELTISILHLHILGLLSSSTASALIVTPPLVSLIVELLFHVKTTAPFRSNLARFVARLLGDSLTRDVIQSWVARETTKIVEQQQRQRKNKKTRSSNNKKKRKRSEILTRRLSPEDLKILSQLPCPIPPLATLIDILALQDNSTNSGSPAPSAILRCKEDVEYAAFRISIAAASLRAAAGDTNGKQETKKTNQVEFVLKLWNAANLDKKSSSSSWLGASVFRYLRSVCDYCSENADPTFLSSDAVIQICRLLTQTLSQERLLDDISTASSSSSETTTMDIVFEAIAVLGSVGKIIRQNCPIAILQELSRCFHRLLSCRHWPIRSFTLSALVSFSSTIPVTHKNILPSCLPDEIRKPLQFRLQNSVLAAPSATDNSLVAQLKCFRILRRTCVCRPMTTKLFPVTNSFHIPSGSFFMKMPTQAGRNAVVIFPPGPQSLEDIKHMLALDQDDDEPKVQTVQRAVTLHDGSCKLLLQD